VAQRQLTRPSRSGPSSEVPPEEVLDLREDVAVAPVAPVDAPPGPLGPQRDHFRTVAVVSFVLDVLAGALSVALVIRAGWDSGRGPWFASAAGGVSWAALLTFARSRVRTVLGLSRAEYERVLHAALLSLLVLALFVDEIDWPVALALLAGAAGLTLAGRLALRSWLRHRVRIGRHVRRLVVVGSVAECVPLAEALARAPSLGITVVGLATDELPAGERVGAWPVLGPPAAAGVLALEHGADLIAVGPTTGDDGALLDLVRTTTDETGVAVVVAVADPHGRGRTIAVPSARLVHVDEPILRSVGWLVKAGFDRIGALVLLILLAPVLAVVAVLVKLDSPGPVLFRQLRAGRGGRPFRIVKFRTMRLDAEELLADLKRRNGHEGAFFKMDEDPRITRIGRWLRRLSVDELPQLWNVLVGEMSLVGPRPLPVSEAAWFSPVDRRRTLVRPGITGLWQVSGRSQLSAEEAVRLDLRYVEHWTLVLDGVILLRTVRAVLRGSGAA
jgi:exopolysaccharide biosynthesis polyprenyl glycosylphosphotransferase